jgi:uncharacterized protein (TIGR04255 family)
MANPRLLNRPPVREAIIDISIIPQLPSDRSLFEPLIEMLKEEFSVAEQRRSFSGGFEIAPETGFVQKPTMDEFYGYVFKTEDNLKVAQFRIDGFTLNKLAPYKDWEEVFPKALELWRIYVNQLKPQKISRLGVRYVNEVRLPLAVKNIGDFLTRPPLIPNELAKNPLVNYFLDRLGFFDSDLRVNVNLTQAYEGVFNEEGVSIILDIDSYTDENVSPSDFERLREIFGRLRELKNQVFFGSITEEAVKLFL